VDGVPYKELTGLKKDVWMEKKLGNYKVIFAEMENPIGQNHFSSVDISYNAPRVSTGKYKQQKIDGEPLYFKNFNFKLAIIQALMYDKELLHPKFDVYDFAQDYVKREIDVDGEGYEPITEVKKWFRDLQIDKRLAEEVTELYLDGGNEVYMQVCPQWDGEDGVFNIANSDEAEFAQFPKLKKITNAMMTFSKKTIRMLEAHGVEIDE
jgi:hypothetical protein